MSEVAALSAGKRNPIMVKMVPLDDHLLLQWMAPKSFREPRMLELNVRDYVDKAASSEVGELLGTELLLLSVAYRHGRPRLREAAASVLCLDGICTSDSDAVGLCQSDCAETPTALQ